MSLRPRALRNRSRRLDSVRVDEIFALALLVETELQVWLSPYIHHRVPSAAGAVALSAAAAVRRRRPLEAVFVALVAVVAQEALGGRVTQHTVGALLALIMLLYSAGALLGDRPAWLALALAFAGSVASVVLSSGRSSDLWFGAIFLEGLPWAVGRIVRERGARERAYRERAERLDAERDHHAASAVWGERSRIARELHDVVAHSVSVMVLQAGGARMVLAADPERAEASLRSVERAGRDALAELRRLLSALSSQDARTLALQPSLRDIEDLIARTQSAGLSTHLRVEGEPVSVSAALDLCAYRIVQEALTNAIKHAGPAHAEVRLRWAPEALDVEISDDGRGVGDANGSSGGHGIPGMRERAALYGGTLEAGPGRGRGFTVRAHLPFGAERPGVERLGMERPGAGRIQ